MLASVLEVMRSLIELDVSFNDVHAVGARHLADALKFNETLLYLNLGGNHVQDQGCGDLAESLKSNETMTTLILAANDLTTSSCYYWLDCLQVNRVSNKKTITTYIVDIVVAVAAERKEIEESLYCFIVRASHR